MLCCIRLPKIRLFTRLLTIAATCVASSFTCRNAQAIEAVPRAGVSLQQLSDFRTQGVPDELWPDLLETLGNDDQKASVRSLVKGLEPFPKAKLVEMLAHQKLAVRLGALRSARGCRWRDVRI